MWESRTGDTEGGGPFIAMRWAVFPEEGERLLHPYMVSVGWAYDEEGSTRLPTESEWMRIESCESALSNAVNGCEALLVGSLTSNGFHQFVVYCREPASTQIHLLESLPPLKEKPAEAERWLIGATSDPEWRYAAIL